MSAKTYYGFHVLSAFQIIVSFYMVIFAQDDGQFIAGIIMMTVGFSLGAITIFFFEPK